MLESLLAEVLLEDTVLLEGDMHPEQRHVELPQEGCKDCQGSQVEE